MNLHCTQWGKQLAIREPFISFLRELGIDAEIRIELLGEGDNGRSGSSLKKWECLCGTKIYAIGELQVRCLKCGGDFVA